MNYKELGSFCHFLFFAFLRPAFIGISPLLIRNEELNTTNVVNLSIVLNDHTASCGLPVRIKNSD
jgi:hypothetical protein